MTEKIDLRPLSAHPAAYEMLMLARGQLNRAFRSKGMLPPDPMLVSQPDAGETPDLDDPATNGIAHIAFRYPDAFAVWSNEMPKRLTGPVLSILRQTYEALSVQDGSELPADAVLTAYEYVLAQMS